MVVADHPRYFPSPVLELPDVEKLRFTDTAGIGGMKKTVRAHLNRPITRQRMHNHRSRHQLADHLPANVVFGHLQEITLADGESGLIVIKLQIVGEIRAESVQV